MVKTLPHVEFILDWLRQQAPSARMSADSRDIRSGDIFVAYPVAGADSRKYIGEAITQGAVAVLFEPADFTWNDQWTVAHMAVPQLAGQAGMITNAYYDHPDQGLTAVAVTGTNGKTSCSQWLARALSLVSGPTGVVGTLGVGTWVDGKIDTLVETGYTTPDAVQMQRIAHDLQQRGGNALAFEASSIGIAQGRMNGLHVDAALFTNLTRDHLDYHGTMEAYEAAKAELFKWPGLRHAVINADDETGQRFIAQLLTKQAGPAVVTYSLAGRQIAGARFLMAEEVRSTQAGTTFQLKSSWGDAIVRLQLVGAFNVANVLGVMGVLLALGHAFDKVVDAMTRLEAVPGRMQQLGGQDAPLVVIDYAHTPDALEKTLRTLRTVAEQRGGELWCVFGCGGDRDPGKRPQMGKVALLSDHPVVTSDNPRSEEPQAIIGHILAGMQEASTPPQVFEDRAAAILWAIKHAAKSDVILLAGKGHENYQEVKGRKLPFLDADHASLALIARVTMMGGA